MPNDPTVWIVFFVAAALVIGLALWFGRGLKIRKDKEGFSFEAKEHQPDKMANQNISVAKNMEIERASIGDIAGIKSTDIDNAIPESKQNIDVLSGGKIKDAQIGDITGIKQEHKSSKD